METKNKNEFVNMITSITHVRSIADFISNAIITTFAFIVGYCKLVVIDSENLFAAVFVVVLFDWIFGVMVAFKNNMFETQKAKKIIFYLSTYWLVLFAVLAVEKAAPSAFWLSDAIIIPILIFQFISMLKNMTLLGFMKDSLLSDLLKNIDRYKDLEIEKNNNEDDTTNT